MSEREDPMIKSAIDWSPKKTSAPAGNGRLITTTDKESVMTGPEPTHRNPRGAKNAERDHRRYVTTASYWVREVAGIRNQDVDLYQYCADCGQPEWFLEAKGSPPPSWSNTKHLSRALGTWALLDIEPFKRDRCPGKSGGCLCPDHTNNSGLHEIKLTALDPTGEVRLSQEMLSKLKFQEFISNVHEYHVRRGHNPDWWKRPC
jgi:hypothetical protein